MRRTLLTGCLLAALLSSATAQDLADKVAVLLRQADTQPLSETFVTVERLDDALGDESEESIRNALVGATKGLGARGRLAAAAMLRDLDDSGLYGKDILEILKPVVTGDVNAGNRDVAIAALGLLGDEKAFNRRVLPDVRDVLDELTSSDLTMPRVRLAAARALWIQGASAQKSAAKRAMTDFLRSQDRSLRVEGAFALADINTDATGPGWRLLRQIATEPTPDGRRAQLYLRLEQERRRFQTVLSELVNAREGGGARKNGEDDGFDVLRELIARAKAQHIQGEDLDDSDLMTAAAKGMMRFLDRHSAFFTSDEFQRFFFDLSREYAGIGAFVNFDQDGDFSIVRPIYSGPAYRKGLRSGDKIIEVDGWETGGNTSEEIIKRLKGPPKTTVTVKIVRPGLAEPEDVAIERRQIQVPSVNFTMLPGKVGYVELITFGADTADETARAIDALTNQGAEGFILDVRNNTGGYLLAARDVVELFVKGRKSVVFTKGRGGKPRYYETRDRARTDLPVAVLVNRFSASASEITAGALQDHDRAIIIGKRSFGKGSVQSLIPVASEPGEPFRDDNRNGAWDQGEEFTDLNANGKFDIGPHVKLTVAKYYLPSGRSIHKTIDKNGKIVDPDWGVKPDIELELLQVEASELWKNAAVFDLFKKNAFRGYVRDRMDKHKDLFLELAEGDDGDWKKWPDFDTYYGDLETQLTKDDVRKWLRYTLRDEVADLRGKVYPGNRALGDHQEDAQLQEAVRQVLKVKGKDIREVPQFKKVLKIAQGKEEKAPAKSAKKNG